MRIAVSLTLFITAVFMLFSAGHAADIKRYLYIPSFQILDNENNFTIQVNQRIIIRLQRTSAARPSSLSRGGRSVPKVKLEEQKIGKCIDVDTLVGFAPGPSDSLEFLTKDKKQIRAYLSDNCKAKEFYAGAYIEKPKDGKLCRKRDIVHARYGAQCELDRFRLLVPETI